MSTNNRVLLEYCFPVGANLLREAQASLTSDKYAYIASTSYGDLLLSKALNAMMEACERGSNSVVSLQESHAREKRMCRDHLLVPASGIRANSLNAAGFSIPASNMIGIITSLPVQGISHAFEVVTIGPEAEYVPLRRRTVDRRAVQT
jgi:hypothetical protein